MPTNERVLDLVKKLLAHEQSAREIGSIAEADAFAAKIQTLCDEYRVGLTDLAPDEMAQSMAYVHWTWKDAGLKTVRRAERWMTLLAGAVAIGHECQETRLSVPGGTIGFGFLGLPADAHVASAMFGVLLRSGLTAWGKVTDKRFKRSSFLWGFALAINGRYRERRKAKVEQSNAAQALVRTIDQARKQFLEQPRFKAARALEAPRANRSMMMGFQAGQATSLDSKTLASAAAQLKA